MYKLLRYMISDGMITSENAVKLAKKCGQQSTDMQTFLIRSNYISEVDLASYLANKFGIDVIDPEDYPIDPEVLNTLPPELVKKWEILPLRLLKERSLMVAMSDPSNVYATETVQQETGYIFSSVSAAPKMRLQKAIEMRYGTGDPRGQN